MFEFVETALDKSSYCEAKRSKVKVTKNENVKIIFCSYFRQKWIDLRQTKPK